MQDAIAAYKEARAAYFAHIDSAEVKAAHEARAKAGEEYCTGRMSAEEYFPIRAAHEAHNTQFDALDVALDNAKERAEDEGAEFCEWTGEIVEAEASEEQTVELFA